MSDARKLNTEDRDKIVDLLKTKQIENVRFAMGLLRETADTADIVALFTNRSLLSQFDGDGDEDDDCVSELKTFLADWAEQQSDAFRTSDDWLAVQITWNEPSDAIDSHIASLTELSESTAAIIALFSGPLNLRQIRSITPEAAHQLSRSDCESIDLSGLQEVDPEIVALLANCNCESIDLSGLQEVDPEIAARLANCNASLLLDGLRELSDEIAAAYLSHHKGPFLSLNGLRHLSTSAARILSHYTGTLYLQSLDHADALDAELARLIFCRPSDDHAEDLYCKTFVPGWSDSHDYESREEEEELENEDKNGAELALNISLAAAKVLVDELRTIDLPITRLTAEIATAFARHQGSLILNQLTELDRLTADALAEHTGSLSLNGLTHLTDETAAALANYQGECLSLTGLNELSDAAAMRLSQFPERLILNDKIVQSKLRTWTMRQGGSAGRCPNCGFSFGWDGTYCRHCKAKATVVGFGDGIVSLRTQKGKTIKIAAEKLDNINATVVAFSDGIVSLKLEEGETIEIIAEKLGDEEQDFLNHWKDSQILAGHEALREKLEEQTLWKNIQCDGNEFKPISS